MLLNQVHFLPYCKSPVPAALVKVGNYSKSEEIFFPPPIFASKWGVLQLPDLPPALQIRSRGLSSETESRDETEEKQERMIKWIAGIKPGVEERCRWGQRHPEIPWCSQLRFLCTYAFRYDCNRILLSALSAYAWPGVSLNLCTFSQTRSDKQQYVCGTIK